MERPGASRRDAREWAKDTSGVSAVVGTVLMVALALVLALIVMLLVDPGGVDEAETVAFTTDEANDRLRLALAGPGLDWSSFQVRASEPDLRVAVTADAAGGMPLGTALATLPAREVAAGDYLEFCVVGGAASVDIDVVDKRANAIVRTASFLSVAAC